jgi:hypothetical protein
VISDALGIVKVAVIGFFGVATGQVVALLSGLVARPGAFLASAPVG